MRQMNLYKYIGEQGCIVSPLELPMEHEPMIRLVADPNKCLKNIETGDIVFVIDIYPNELTNWEEIDKPEDENVPVTNPIDPDEIAAEEFVSLIEEVLL